MKHRNQTPRTLRMLREMHNYSQGYVADEVLGISQASYTRLEREDVGEIKGEYLRRLAEFYKVELEALVLGYRAVVVFEYPEENGKGRETEQVILSGERQRLNRIEELYKCLLEQQQELLSSIDVLRKELRSLQAT